MENVLKHGRPRQHFGRVFLTICCKMKRRPKFLLNSKEPRTKEVLVIRDITLRKQIGPWCHLQDNEV